MIPEIIAEVQISYSSHIKAKDRLKITGSMDAANAFRAIWPAYVSIPDKLYNDSGAKCTIKKGINL